MFGPWPKALLCRSPMLTLRLGESVVSGWLWRQDVSQAVCSAGLNGRVVPSVYNILSVRDTLWHTVHSAGGGCEPRGDLTLFPLEYSSFLLTVNHFELCGFVFFPPQGHNPVCK